MIQDCNICDYCSPKEWEQSKDKEPHMCKFLNKQIKHYTQGWRRHSRIKPHENCPYDTDELAYEKYTQSRE